MKNLNELIKIDPSNASPISIYNHLPNIGKPDTVEEAVRTMETVGKVRKYPELWNNCIKIIKEDKNGEKSP